VAFITGAHVGLGKATTLRLAADGFDIVASDLSLDLLKSLDGEAALADRKVTRLALDVRRHDAIKRSVAEALERMGRIDVLVNNAGRQLRAFVVDTEWDDYDDVMNTNLKGAYFLSAEVARHWLTSKLPGNIVNICSTHSFTGVPEGSVYGISKGGLAQMTRMMAIEWATDSIRVNGVAPATVLTPSRELLLADPARRQRMLERLPQRRFPTPEDIANAVSYLADPRNVAVTGHILPVDAGLLSV
jgi:2-deoxy-D-gluconate 3-dehydrogenase